MGRQLCKFNGLGAMQEASGTVRKTGKSGEEMVLVVGCRVEVEGFSSRLETDGWIGDTKSAQRLQVARGEE